MKGLGLMLPLITVGGSAQAFSRKATKHETKHRDGSESDGFSLLRRSSTIKTQSTDTQINGVSAMKKSTSAAGHHRDLSLTVGFDVERAAQQIQAGDISDLDLALFAYWIRAGTDNYILAKELVRELALDQVHRLVLHICGTMLMTQGLQY